MKGRLTLIALALCFVQSLPIGSQPAAGPEIVKEIQAMEMKFFVHDFSKESLNYRVARLEKFTFGQPSPGPMSQRIKRLEGVIDLHKALVPQTVSADNSLASRPAPAKFVPADIEPAARAKYPHVTTLESQILGQTFENDPLNERLVRLEMKAFGKQSDSLDLAVRTDALEDHIERKMYIAHHRQQRPTVSDESIVPEFSSASSTSSAAGMSNGNLPDYSKIAGFGSPVNATRMPTFSDLQIFMDAPPDAHARMLTRVAWCEQHLFGHTFPQLHLPQRLHQLNAKLNPAKHDVSDVALMDSLDGLVREVVMIQHPPLVSTQPGPQATQSQ